MVVLLHMDNSTLLIAGIIVLIVVVVCKCAHVENYNANVRPMFIRQPFNINVEGCSKGNTEGYSNQVKSLFGKRNPVVAEKSNEPLGFFYSEGQYMGIAPLFSGTSFRDLGGASKTGDLDSDFVNAMRGD